MWHSPASSAIAEQTGERGRHGGRRPARDRAADRGRRRLPGQRRRAVRRDRPADRGPPGRCRPRDDRRLLRLRHLAGVRLLVAQRGPAPTPRRPPTTTSRAPGSCREIAAEDLTPELIRAGILRDGCLLVRGLLDRDAAPSALPTRSTAPSPSASARSRASRRPGLLRGVRGPAAVRDRRRRRGCGSGGRRCAGGRLAAAGDRDARDVPGGRACSELVEGYLGERADDLPAEDDAAQGRAPAWAAPGTRTARSWATCAR